MQGNNRSEVHTTFKARIILIISGFLFCFLFLEAALRLGGFVVLSMQEYKNRQALNQKGTYRIMCLGESTTAGQYPLFLQEILNQRDIGIKFKVIDKGIPGINTEDILDRLESNIKTYDPDMVIAMMGVNDKGVYTPYETISSSTIKRLLLSLRTYKLARLLGRHIRSKTQGRRLFELEKGGDSPGKVYQDQREFIRAENIFKEALKIDPKDIRAWVALANLYKERSLLSKAETSFKKAIELAPRDVELYIHLSQFYHTKGQFSQEEELLKEAIKICPANDRLYFELARNYKSQGKYARAEDMFNKSIKLNPQNSRSYLELEEVYLGQRELAKEYTEKLIFTTSGVNKPITINNYSKVKEILYKRGISLVVVQYPLRSLKSLKKIFKDDEGIIFLDNESTFKVAVNKDDYSTYFRDMFAGDFGHCTHQGNRLLAENIADVILKEVFHE